MKTAISLPDELFERGEHVARKLKMSRSEVYREALAEYVAKHDPDAITEALDASLATEDDAQDAFVSRAARSVLRRTEW